MRLPLFAFSSLLAASATSVAIAQEYQQYQQQQSYWEHPYQTHRDPRQQVQPQQQTAPHPQAQAYQQPPAQNQQAPQQQPLPQQQTAPHPQAQAHQQPLAKSQQAPQQQPLPQQQTAQAVPQAHPAAQKGDTQAQPSPAMASPSPASREVYTISNINIDITADTAAQARDKALTQAQRTAYVQLCERLGAANNVDHLTDDDMAYLVQSFEVQSERLSPVRYIGTFTIRFNPALVQKKLVLSLQPTEQTAQAPQASPQEPVSMMMPLLGDSRLGVQVRANSLAEWTQIKRRLGAIPIVSKIDTQGLGRGNIQVEISYAGTLDELRDAILTQNLVLRQMGNGLFELYDGAVVVR